MGEQSERTTWWFKLCSSSRGRWEAGGNLCRVLTGLRTPWSKRFLPWSKDRLRRTCRRISFRAGKQHSPGSHYICRRVTGGAFAGKDPWHSTTLWRVLAAPSTSVFTCREWAIHQWVNPPFPSHSLWAEPWAHSDILPDPRPERIWHCLGVFGQWIFGAGSACRGGRSIPTQ